MLMLDTSKLYGHENTLNFSETLSFHGFLGPNESCVMDNSCADLQLNTHEYPMKFHFHIIIYSR